MDDERNMASGLILFAAAEETGKAIIDQRIKQVCVDQEEGEEQRAADCNVG